MFKCGREKNDKSILWLKKSTIKDEKEIFMTVAGSVMTYELEY